jgi:hypothetical protein
MCAIGVGCPLSAPRGAPDRPPQRHATAAARLEEIRHVANLLRQSVTERSQHQYQTPQHAVRGIYCWSADAIQAAI